jgi:hypothetical protein
MGAPTTKCRCLGYWSLASFRTLSYPSRSNLSGSRVRTKDLFKGE